MDRQRNHAQRRDQWLLKRHCAAYSAEVTLSDTDGSPGPTAEDPVVSADERAELERLRAQTAELERLRAEAAAEAAEIERLKAETAELRPAGGPAAARRLAGSRGHGSHRARLRARSAVGAGRVERQPDL